MVARIYTYSLDVLPPGRMIIDVLGGGAESPRSVTGDSGAIDYNAGLWSVRYSDILVHHAYQHRYWSWLGGMLNTRTRMIRVPILSDWFAPVPGNNVNLSAGPLYIGGIPHSDGTMHSDGAGYSQSTISAELYADAAMGDGTIQIAVNAGGTIFGGEIFSILHPTQDWRAYKIVDIDDVIDRDTLGAGIGDEFGAGGSDVLGAGGGLAAIYTVSLNMPIKEDVPAETPLKFDRPLCIMRLAPNTTLPLDVIGRHQSRPEANFLEAGDLS